MLLNIKTIDANGTNYVIAENRTVKNPKADLVFIHGICGNYREFFTLMELVKDQYNIIAINLPGFGRSESLPFFSVDRMVKDISQIITQFKKSKTILVGHSLGGVVGYLVASRAQIIDKLVTLNSPVKKEHILKPSADYLKLFTKFSKSDPFLDLLTSLKNSKLGYDLMDKVIAPYIDKGVKEMNDVYKYNYASETLAETNTKAAGDYARYLVEFDLTSDIASIKIPTLSVFGTDDHTVSIETADYIKSVNPAFLVKVLEKFDHGGQITQPSRVYDLLNEFI